ncbi:GGDEF domain-containing protein [Methylopila turkensis]|uniref:diguanylate cyclase n=1 Tax=Methylopila turkensis TaxID=1437816 RepID=A0A9W6N6Y0_9HYPH|nr:sensor domain-containing diguanylate cyclase [Methylopila turkensis]GLK79796.1 hypothetical protein GCM10008174_15370 [Methylopila turkensis]
MAFILSDTMRSTASEAQRMAQGDDEGARLRALDRYDILETPREETFDRITRLARRIFGTSTASVTLVDGHRQWFKAREGLDATETPRWPAFCHATVKRAAPLVVTDASIDPDFAENPFVVGDPRIRFYAGAPLMTPDGHAIGALCVIDQHPRAFGRAEVAILEDLAKIVMDEMELRLLATQDALTGVLSRRAFREEAERALRLAVRHGHDLSILMVDLDRFKSVNDRFGHAAGDAVLGRSAAACVGQLRGSDVIGRLGGEEFAIALPHAGARAALEVAERLRQAIVAETHTFGGATIQMTASFGVASRGPSSADVDELLRDADAALYLAKAQGRNRCVAAGSEERETEATGFSRVLKNGRILTGHGAAAVECTVRSLSGRGARIDVSSAAEVPERFDLAIGAEDLAHPCRVVRVAHRHIEVEFL